MKRRQQKGGPAASILLAVLLSACTIVGHEKVAGWPALQMVEHYVPHSEMRERCVQYTGFGMSPEACAEFDLVRRRCDIWYSADFPPGPEIIEHERLHCQGYDHIGGTTLAQILREFSASAQAEASASAGASQPRN
jgi:hypothetical protein